MTTDRALARINMKASGLSLAMIPFTKGYVPKPDSSMRELPEASTVVSTYTRAEGEALAAVFAPGFPLSAWTPYTVDFESYESELTDRSPARESKCLGQWAMTQVGDETVVLFRNECHMDTDSRSIPLRRVWRQLIEAVKPGRWIDTGTAGAIGADIVEGDTIVADNLRFDCQKWLEREPFAQAVYPCTYDTSGIDFSLAERLMQANAEALRPVATRDPKVWRGDVLTTDSFAFDTSTNAYGLQTVDTAARCCEMDAAALGLVAEDLGSAMPAYCSLRSASDPQIQARGRDLQEMEKEADEDYEHDGGPAQVETLCAVWQVIAGV